MPVIFSYPCHTAKSVYMTHIHASFQISSALPYVPGINNVTNKKHKAAGMNQPAALVIVLVIVIELLSGEPDKLNGGHFFDLPLFCPPIPV